MTRTVRTALIALGGLAAFLAWGYPSPVLAEEGGLDWAALSDSDLDTERARGVLEDFQMEATLNGGEVNVDGAEMANEIAGGAFAGSAGIVNVIQNNGNQAIIQNGVIVNVNVYQGTP